MGWSLHQMDVKTVLLNKLIEEEAYVEKPQVFEVYQKETHEYRWKNIVYSRSVVKTSYDRGSVSK
jgi:hypothetical protein